jgi:NADH-quinone oxidoreductase subunit H
MIIDILVQIFYILIYPGLLFLLVFGMLYFGILRKLTARMQNRIGPPIWQPILDTIKLFGKESIQPEQAKTGFTLWPIIALASVLVAGVLTPIAGIVGLEVAGGFIVLIYFLLFGALAIYLAGFSSSNPFATVGSMRGVIQMIGYEFPFIVSLVVPILVANTLSPLAVNAFQLSAGSGTGLPWIGMVFPLAALAYFVSVLAKTELPPFHVPDAHTELVSGYSTEYSGFRLAIIELTRMVKVFVLVALGVAVFLGGAAPGLVGFGIFLIKSLAVLGALALLRVLFARIRIDHVVRLCWIIGLIGLIDLVRVLLA